MPSMSPFTKALPLSVAVLLVGAGSGFAVEAQPAAEALKAAFARQDVTIEWSTATASGDKVTLEGVRIVPAQPAKPVDVGTIVLDGVEETDGSYYVGTMSIPGFTSTEQDVSLEVSNVTVTNLDLSVPEADSADFVIPYDSVDIDSLKLTEKGKQRLAIDDFYAEATVPEDESPITFTGRADNFQADLSEVEDPATRKVIEAMNYTRLVGSFDMSGNWNPQDGKTNLEEFNVSVEDAGTLSLSMELGGYTPALIEQLRETQAKMEGAGKDDPAAGMAFLGLLQQMTFVNAQIGFTDDQLTQRAIDYVATEQKAQPADIVNQAKALLPFMLGQLNNPEFSQQVTAAVSAYLDDPQNLTIKLSPASPVPFAMLFAGAMTTPQALPQQLGASVVANETP